MRELFLNAEIVAAKFRVLRPIHQVFSGLKFREQKFLRAHSAYCTQEVIKACLSLGATFTLTVHGNMQWDSNIEQITTWDPWQYSEGEMARAKKKWAQPVEIDSLFKLLPRRPECEEFHY